MDVWVGFEEFWFDWGGIGCDVVGEMWIGGERYWWMYVWDDCYVEWLGVGMVRGFDVGLCDVECLDLS